MNIYLNMPFGHYCDNISFWSWNVVLAMNDDAEKIPRQEKIVLQNAGFLYCARDPFRPNSLNTPKSGTAAN